MKEPNARPRYGEALLHVAEKLNAVEAVLEGARAVREVVRREPRLLVFLDVPQVSAARKKAVVRTVFAGKLHPVLLNFLLLLVDRQRAEDLLEIFEAFELAWDRRRGVHPVEIRTAVPIPGDLREKMQRKLEQMSGGRVRVSYVVDPSIIGGVVAMFADTGTDIDGSIRRALERLKETLLNVPVR
jgi:F-type H+-transporting ATPase subunit delta